MNILNGIDRFDQYASLFDGKRVGLITNPSGVTVDLKATADILAAHTRLSILFGPEHGIRGAAQAGAAVSNDVDPVTGVPVVSLFGASSRITPEQFEMLDILAYDIQDVGARFYTYIYTLSYAMEDAAKAGKPVVVFDRINPLGGETCEGILLDDTKISSFVGMYPMPARYALTVGEYAQYINETRHLNCNLTVIPCDAHPRSMLFPESGQLWISPSPNIPTFDSALAYIGTCIFEGTNISEGRGTTHPFEFVGAPFINGEALADNMNAMNLPGILWRPVSFTPTFQKFANEPCQGVQLHFKDRHAARPFEAGLKLLQQILIMAGNDVTFRNGHFNNILGTDTVLNGSASLDDVIAQACDDVKAFALESSRFKLY